MKANKVTMSDKWVGLCQLMRLEKPVGIYLLLWPTVWALWFAADGMPPFHIYYFYLGRCVNSLGWMCD